MLHREAGWSLRVFAVTSAFLLFVFLEMIRRLGHPGMATALLWALCKSGRESGWMWQGFAHVGHMADLHTTGPSHQDSIPLDAQFDKVHSDSASHLPPPDGNRWPLTFENKFSKGVLRSLP